MEICLYRVCVEQCKNVKTLSVSSRICELNSNVGHGNYVRADVYNIDITSQVLLEFLVIVRLLCTNPMCLSANNCKSYVAQFIDILGVWFSWIYYEKVP